MAQFDPKKVLRQVSNDLLRQLFEHCNCPIDVPWAELSETDVTAIFNAWQQMEEAPRRNIEIVLHEIGEMAIEDGISSRRNLAHLTPITLLTEQRPISQKISVFLGSDDQRCHRRQSN